MPSSKGLSPQNKRKLQKIYAICNSSQKKYGLSDKKKENCLLGIAKRMNIHREMKNDISYKKDEKKMCKC